MKPMQYSMLNSMLSPFHLSQPLSRHALQALLITSLVLLIISQPLSATSNNTAEKVDTQPHIKILERSPRDFGFVLGDILRQRLLLTLPSGQDLNENTLPSLGSMNDWLELREFHFKLVPSANKTSSTETRYELDFSYQLFKQLDTPGNITIPSSTLLTDAAKPIALPPWTISYTTLLPLKAPHDIPLRQASAPKLLATHIWLERAYLALAGLLACLVLGGLWWLYLPYSQRRQLAFSRTRRRLQQLIKQQPNDTSALQAYNLFENALTKHAGHTLFLDQLDDYFAQHQHFQVLAKDTRSLLQQAQLARFAPANDTTHTWPRAPDVLRLCEAFSRKEQAVWKR